MNRVTDDPRLGAALTELAFHILIALGNGPAHGYAIGKDVEEQSGGRLDPSTGTLYSRGFGGSGNKPSWEGRRDVWMQLDARFGTPHAGWYGARRSR
jgi:Transcriptional regulator PadR-like family